MVPQAPPGVGSEPVTILAPENLCKQVVLAVYLLTTDTVNSNFRLVLPDITDIANCP